MKTKLLITSLSLIATSAYAQPSIPAVGVPPPAVRAEMPGQGVPSMPQPAMQRPAPQMNQSSPQPAVDGSLSIYRVSKLPTPTGVSTPMSPLPANDAKAPTSVGATLGSGENGGNGAIPTPSVTMYNGVGPLPANDAKAPTSVGASHSRAQTKVEVEVQRQKAKDEVAVKRQKAKAQILEEAKEK